MTQRNEPDANRTQQSASAPSVRRGKRQLALIVLALLAFCFFAAMGTWQIYRLQWKLELIERVDQRIHAEPLAAPGPHAWATVTAESDEYRPVTLTGVYLYDKSSLVLASTSRGAGYWVLTPLRTEAGWDVLVNRGFLPVDSTGRMMALDDTGQPRGVTVVTGLLRISEPGGGFLRKNDGQVGRWYSRDVAAIAGAHGLSNVAPYFVDAGPAPGGEQANQPVGGLTVVSFRNHHLVYALTWYALALMVAGAIFWIRRQARRVRGDGRQPRQ